MVIVEGTLSDRGLAAVRTLAYAGVSTSVISVFGEEDLKEIASKGGGRYIEVDEINRIDEAIAEDLEALRP